MVGLESSKLQVWVQVPLSAHMTNKTIEVKKNKILISFPFDWDIVNAIRPIQGRDFDKESRTWTLPYTAWHCSQVIERLSEFGFFIPKNITERADPDAKKPDIEYPDGLYDFQKEAVDFMYKADGRAIIGDEMGLGKTIESLAFVKLSAGKTLVIAPANVIYKWEEEWQKWGGDGECQVVGTTKDKISDADCIIMSYAIMVLKFTELQDMYFDCIIFDEGHYLKNYKAKRTRIAKALVKGGIQKVLFLSGTPFMNRPSELFSLLNMLDPTSFANFFSYAKAYCGAQYLQGQWYFPPNTVTNEEELKERLKSYMIRRTKKEVSLQLPELTRTSLVVDIKNRSEYNKAVRDIRSWLSEKGREVVNHKHVLTRLNVLRQVVGEGKAEHAIELAETILDEGRKVVLFCHHKEIVTLLVNGLKKYGVKVIDGSTPAKERKENSNLFLSLDSGIRVMVITTAGGIGIDLYSASDLIVVERQWTPAVEEQVEARLHRIGQKNHVNVYYLVAKSTVDEKLDKIVRKKREVIGKVISQDEIVEEILEDL